MRMAEAVTTQEALYEEFVRLLEGLPFSDQDLLRAAGWKDTGIISRKRNRQVQVTIRDIYCLKEAIRLLRDEHIKQLQAIDIDNTPSVAPGDTHGQPE